MMAIKQPGEKIRGGVVPRPGTRCSSCGRPANFACSCGCSAAGCYRCVREGKIK
jgi:hypothetical protein